MSGQAQSVVPAPQARPAVVACCLPSIAGTTGLAILALASSLHARGPLPLAFQASALVLLSASFVAAAWGPALIPLGLLAELLDGRRRGRLDAFSWTMLGAALATTAVTYGWLLDAIELP